MSTTRENKRYQRLRRYSRRCADIGGKYSLFKRVYVKFGNRRIKMYRPK